MCAVKFITNIQSLKVSTVKILMFFVPLIVLSTRVSNLFIESIILCNICAWKLIVMFVATIYDLLPKECSIEFRHKYDNEYNQCETIFYRTYASRRKMPNDIDDFVSGGQRDRAVEDEAKARGFINYTLAPGDILVKCPYDDAHRIRYV